MSARISKGDTVRCTHGEPDSGLFVGRNYEAKEVYVRSATGDAYIDVGVDPDGWRAERFEKVEPEHAEPEDKDDLYVEPEPLKEGEWTQAWVRVVDASVIGGEVTICVPRMEGDWRYLSGMVHISEDALIRTDDTPPWVKEEQPVTVTISGTRVFSEESGAPMIRLETGPGSYALIPVANISSITEGGAS